MTKPTQQQAIDTLKDNFDIKGDGVAEGRSSSSDSVGAFRPLQTKAERDLEIANKEREEAIKAMLGLDCHPSEGMLSRSDFCKALYDAGYRKVKELSDEDIEGSIYYDHPCAEALAWIEGAKWARGYMLCKEK